ncbi:MAG TPA: RNA polymerase sigma factor [Vicinamibacterales bacterium]
MSAALTTDRVPDDELVQRTAAGNAEAFAALYRRRRPDVFRFTLHMTADAALAEDVVQDVFVTVMHDGNRFEPGRATVAAWLCGIARNHLRQRLARDRRLQPLAHDEESLPDTAVVQPDALVDLIRAEQIESLRRAVLSLPLRYREAVVLCDLQELSYLDAAEALSCAVGTVRSRLHRGRALLTAKLRAAAVDGEVAEDRADHVERGPIGGSETRKVGATALDAGGCVS